MVNWSSAISCHIIRTPELLLDVTIQPIMFVCSSAIVFGGAIAIQGTQLRQLT